MESGFEPKPSDPLGPCFPDWTVAGSCGGRHSEETPVGPCTPTGHPGAAGLTGCRGDQPSWESPGVTFAPCFSLTTQPISHHKPFQLSKGERMEPELLAGLLDFGLPAWPYWYGRSTQSTDQNLSSRSSGSRQMPEFLSGEERHPLAPEPG